MSCGRDGPEPIVIHLPTLPEQAAKIAELLQGAHADGFAWGDMAVLCRTEKSATCAPAPFTNAACPCKTAGGRATTTRWPTA